MRSTSSAFSANCDLVAVQLQLAERVIDPPQCLLGLESARVVLFGNEHGEEERAFSTFARTRQIPLSVGVARAHAAAVVELAVQRVDVGVEDQRALVHGPGARRDLRGRLIGWRPKGWSSAQWAPARRSGEIGGGSACAAPAG